MFIEDVEFVEVSGVTAKGYRHRTTIPKGFFKKCALRDKDELKWVILKDGTAIVSKVKKTDVKSSL